MLLDVWFGGVFDLKESSWSPEKGRPFVETDGRRLYVPAVMSNRDEAILAVLHGAGHMRYGTFDRLAMKEMFEAGATRVSRVGSGVVGAAFHALRRRCAALPVDFRFVRRPARRFSRAARRAELSAAAGRDRARDRRASSRQRRLFRPRALERGRRAARGASRRPRRRALHAAARARRDRRRRLSAGDRDLQRRCAAARSRSRSDACGVSSRTRSQRDAARASAGVDDQQQQSQAGAEQQNQQQEEGEEESQTPQNAESGRSAGQRQARGSRRVMARAAARRRSRRAKGDQRGTAASSDKGVPYPEWDYREGALQAQLELGAGEAARGIEHGGDQPPHEPVFERAEASEESDPVAEAHAARAAAAAARRRRHGSERGGELRRREKGRGARRIPRSIGGAKCASARSP